MKSHSSTSNSEQSFKLTKVPWALLIALGLIISVEVIIRMQEPANVIPYENTGRNAYGALRNYLNVNGAADIGFLGSSRGREAIAAPLVKEQLQVATGNDYYVANYSSPAATADEIEQIVRLILREENKPKILLYGVSPLQLSSAALSTTHGEELWYLQDWFRKNQEQEKRREAQRYMFGVVPNYRFNLLSDVMRNELGRYYMTFAYRGGARLLFSNLFSNHPHISCPIIGELSDSQSKSDDRSLVTHPITNKRVQAYLKGRMKGDKYPMARKQIAYIRSAIKLCREEGVPFIIYELPIADILKENMPKETPDEFIAMMNKLVTQEGAEFVRLSDLGLEFSDIHFREQSHMNLLGAEKMTNALVEQVIIPKLSGNKIRGQN